MTLISKKGDILTSGASYIGIPVNTEGVMGAGLALAAKKKWPEVDADYRWWCQSAERRGGDIAWSKGPVGPGVILIATKERWRDPSKLVWIETACRRLAEQMSPDQLMALPLLGAGLGGLPELQVLDVLERRLGAGRPHRVEVWRR